MHLVHFYHLYMNEIIILFHYYLYQLNLGNFQQKLLPLIISCFHPNVDFVFIYQLFHWIFSIRFPQFQIFFLVFSWKESFLVFPHSVEPIILTLSIWNENFSIVVTLKKKKDMNKFLMKKMFLCHNFPSLLFVLFSIT